MESRWAGFAAAVVEAAAVDAAAEDIAAAVVAATGMKAAPEFGADIVAVDVSKYYNYVVTRSVNAGVLFFSGCVFVVGFRL